MTVRKIYLLLKYKLFIMLGRGNKWHSSGGKSNLKGKKFSTYNEYLKHQKSKLDIIEDLTMANYEKKYFKSLIKRLKISRYVASGSSVLCLAARMGAEVRAFNELGCFAIGIDLNPGKENKNVVYGDFHNLQWKKNTVDIVFSNSLDHAYDLKKVLGEIKRVLTIDGLVILEVVKGKNEGVKLGYWETLAWDSINDFTNELKKNGLKIIYQTDFTYPWRGKHLILRLSKRIYSQ